MLHSFRIFAIAWLGGAAARFCKNLPLNSDMPCVSSVSPKQGGLLGGQLVTIEGANLMPGSAGKCLQALMSEHAGQQR